MGNKQLLQVTYYFLNMNNQQKINQGSFNCSNLENNPLEEANRKQLKNYKLTTNDVGILQMNGTNIEVQEIKELLSNKNAQRLIQSKVFGNSCVVNQEELFIHPEDIPDKRMPEKIEEKELNSRQLNILRQLVNEDSILKSLQMSLHINDQKYQSNDFIEQYDKLLHDNYLQFHKQKELFDDNSFKQNLSRLQNEIHLNDFNGVLETKLSQSIADEMTDKKSIEKSGHDEYSYRTQNSNEQKIRSFSQNTYNLKNSLTQTGLRGKEDSQEHNELDKSSKYDSFSSQPKIMQIINTEIVPNPLKKIRSLSGNACSRSSLSQNMCTLNSNETKKSIHGSIFTDPNSFRQGLMNSQSVIIKNNEMISHCQSKERSINHLQQQMLFQSDDPHMTYNSDAISIKPPLESKRINYHNEVPNNLPPIFPNNRKCISIDSSLAAKKIISGIRKSGQQSIDTKYTHNKKIMTPFISPQITPNIDHLSSDVLQIGIHKPDLTQNLTVLFDKYNKQGSPTNSTEKQLITQNLTKFTSDHSKIIESSQKSNLFQSEQQNTVFPKGKTNIQNAYAQQNEWKIVQTQRPEGQSFEQSSYSQRNSVGELTQGFKIQIKKNINPQLHASTSEKAQILEIPQQNKLTFDMKQINQNNSARENKQVSQKPWQLQQIERKEDDQGGKIIQNEWKIEKEQVVSNQLIIENEHKLKEVKEENKNDSEQKLQESITLKKRRSLNGEYNYKRSDLRMNESIEFNKSLEKEEQIKLNVSNDSQEKLLQLAINSAAKRCSLEDAYRIQSERKENAKFSKNIHKQLHMEKNDQNIEESNTSRNDQRCQEQINQQLVYLKSRMKLMDVDDSIQKEIYNLESKVSTIFAKIRNDKSSNSGEPSITLRESNRLDHNRKQSQDTLKMNLNEQNNKQESNSRISHNNILGENTLNHQNYSFKLQNAKEHHHIDVYNNKQHNDAQNVKNQVGILHLKKNASEWSEQNEDEQWENENGREDEESAFSEVSMQEKNVTLMGVNKKSVINHSDSLLGLWDQTSVFFNNQDPYEIDEEETQQREDDNYFTLNEIEKKQQNQSQLEQRTYNTLHRQKKDFELLKIMHILDDKPNNAPEDMKLFQSIASPIQNQYQIHQPIPAISSQHSSNNIQAQGEWSARYFHAINSIQQEKQNPHLYEGSNSYSNNYNKDCLQKDLCSINSYINKEQSAPKEKNTLSQQLQQKQQQQPQTQPQHQHQLLHQNQQKPQQQQPKQRISQQSNQQPSLQNSQYLKEKENTGPEHMRINLSQLLQSKQKSTSGTFNNENIPFQHQPQKQQILSSGFKLRKLGPSPVNSMKKHEYFQNKARKISIHCQINEQPKGSPPKNDTFTRSASLSKIQDSNISYSHSDQNRPFRNQYRDKSNETITHLYNQHNNCNASSQSLQKAHHHDQQVFQQQQQSAPKNNYWQIRHSDYNKKQVNYQSNSKNSSISNMSREQENRINKPLNVSSSSKPLTEITRQNAITSFTSFSHHIPSIAYPNSSKLLYQK